jgi:hypothetical protein
MRHSHALFILILGLPGCAVGDVQRPSANYMTPGRTATYMAPEQSATLMTMPGDTTTLVQMRYLSTTSINDDRGASIAVSPRQ